MASLNHNIVLKTLAVAKQLEVLKKKIKEKNRSIQKDDLQPFRTLCYNEDFNTATLACNAIIDFVKYNNLPIFQAISWFVTSLQTTGNMQALIKAITELLLLSIRFPSSEENVFLNSLQHPFILILKQNYENWLVIENQIKLLFNENPDHVFALLKRVFMYVLWSPCQTVDTFCKRHLWTFLTRNIKVDIDFFVQTLCCVQRNNKIGALDVCYFLTNVCEKKELVEELHLYNILCVMLAENSCKLVEHGHHPEFCLHLTKILLKKYPATTDLVLMLFAQILLTCPAEYLHLFVQTSVDLIRANGFRDITVVWMIISALLPWLIHPMSAIDEVHRTAKLIFNITEKNKKEHQQADTLKELRKDNLFTKFIISSSDGYWVFVLNKALEKYTSTELLDRMRESFYSLEDVHLNCMLTLFINGLLLASNDSYIQKSAVHILMKMNPGFQLPVILFLLSKTKDTDMQLLLLNSLPLTAVDKNNVSPILVILTSFINSGQKVLVQQSIQLFLKLWKIEKRTYPYLSEQLMTNRVIPPNRDWEMDVVIAASIRDICTLEPVKHGKEWVGLLSDIMNRCSERCNYLPFVLAVEAILKLCEAGVINVLTVFEQFSKQHLFEDSRPEVIAKLCEVVELIFIEMKETTFGDHDALMTEALRTMWNLVTAFRHETITIAAMKTLSKFDVSLMPLKVIPEEYRRDVKFPEKYANTSNPENELPYVPGTVWITFLLQIREEIKMEACAMLANWLQLELAQLGRGFYHSIRGEPSDVSFLHEKSIFKTLVKYLKKLARSRVPCSEDEIRTVSMCFIILNDTNVKKLPQFNWTFLEQFLKYENAELFTSVINFFAKQSDTSLSAKKGIENYVKSLKISSCENKELRLLLSLLPKMGCSITPNIFTSTLSSTIDRILKHKSDSTEGLYLTLCERLRETLKQPNLNEHNRDCVCRSVISIWEHISVNDELFESVIGVIREMPFNYIELLIVCEDPADLSVDKLVKILMLNCTIALKEEENPFKWIDYSTDITTHLLLESDIYFILLADVLRKHQFHSGKWTWLLQFMNRISKAIDDTSTVDEKVNFMFDALIFSVVNVSSFSIYLEDSMSVAEYGEYFSQALNNIITDQVSSKVIEWIYYIIKWKKIGNTHKLIFKDAIVALRYDKYFQKTSVWNKIFSDCF